LLKITLQQSRRSKTLKLEGKLAGPWVEELERTWRGLNASRHAKYLQVDLCAVTFVDARGKELLAKMFNSGADLIAEAPLTRHVVEEIMPGQGSRKREGKTRRRRA
jgi:ABC-type transporter Mla MlaB component